MNHLLPFPDLQIFVKKLSSREFINYCVIISHVLDVIDIF